MLSLKTLGALFWGFLKVGIFGFGGGFAMIPLMQSISIQQYHWLDYSQFSAAIAMGQITPGPVAISAAFIGYKAAGVTGALVATIGIFLPSLLAMYLLARFYLLVRKSRITHGIMHGVLPVVVALIVNVAVSMGEPDIHSFWQTMIIVLATILAVKNKVNYGLIVAGSTAAGIIFTLAGKHF